MVLLQVEAVHIETHRLNRVFINQINNYINILKNIKNKMIER